MGYPVEILRALRDGPMVFRFEFRRRAGKMIRPALVAGEPEVRDALLLMARSALVALRVDKNEPRRPSGYRETYTLTALGRREAGIEVARKPLRHRGTRPASDEFEYDDHQES